MTEQPFDEVTIYDFDDYLGLVEFGHGATPFVLGHVGKSRSLEGTSLYITDDRGQRYIHRKGVMDHDEADRLERYWYALATEANLRSRGYILTVGKGLSRTSPTGERFLIGVYKYIGGAPTAHAYTIRANSTTRGGQYRFEVRVLRDTYNEAAADVLAVGIAADAAADLLRSADGDGKRDLTVPLFKDGWCVY